MSQYAGDILSCRMALVILLVFTICIDHTSSVCPKLCSGHGSCGQNNICTCDANYTLASDCSLMSCPLGVTLANKPESENTAHNLLECSNQGSCNRKTGTCSCAQGFSGQACEKLTCNFDNCTRQ